MLLVRAKSIMGCRTPGGLQSNSEIDWQEYRALCIKAGCEVRLCVTPLVFLIHVGVAFEPIFPANFAELLERSSNGQEDPAASKEAV